MTTDSLKVYGYPTTQQPNSKTSFQFELTRETLSQVLGWRPDGRGIEEVDALLHEGVGVEVRQGRDGVAYRLVPFIGELAEGDLPSVESVIVRRVDDE